MGWCQEEKEDDRQQGQRAENGAPEIVGGTLTSILAGDGAWRGTAMQNAAGRGGWRNATGAAAWCRRWGGGGQAGGACSRVVTIVCLWEAH